MIPCLFNLFMDKYATALTEGMERSEVQKDKWQLKMFADDIILQTVDSELLKQLLILSHKWAEANEITWSTGKCAVLTPSSCRPDP